MKGHIYFIPITPAGPKSVHAKKTKKNLTALKQDQDALPSFAWLYNLLIPPYFCFSKRGTLYCSALETLPPKVYSNSTRQRAGWREKGKKTQGKVGEKYKQKPGKYYNHLCNWNRSHIYRWGFTCLPCFQVWCKTWTGVFFFKTKTGGLGLPSQRKSPWD